MNCSDLCSIGMKEGNLSPPVLAKNKGTEVFRLVSAAKAKLAGACPISCLYCIGANTFHEYSPSLRRGEVSGSVPQIQTYYTSELVSSMVTVPRFEESELSGSVPDSMPILHWSERLRLIQFLYPYRRIRKTILPFLVFFSRPR